MTINDTNDPRNTLQHAITHILGTAPDSEVFADDSAIAYAYNILDAALMAVINEAKLAAYARGEFRYRVQFSAWDKESN